MPQKYAVKSFGNFQSLEDWLNEYRNEIEDFKIAMNHRIVVLVVEWKAV